MNPQIATVVIVVALSYYGGRAVVHGVKKVGHAVVHVIKHEHKQK